MKTQPLLYTVNSMPKGIVSYLGKKVRRKYGTLSRALPKLENLVEDVISKITPHRRTTYNLKYVSSYKDDIVSNWET